MGKTLFEKLWSAHVVDSVNETTDIIYIDRHFIHEVTSPVAFLGIKDRGVGVMRPNQTIATPDHNVPTVDQHLPIKETLSRIQVDTLSQNCNDQGISLYGLGHPFHGVVHIVGPELGITLPGMTIVCGDSHTSTHGAFGSIAFGIGTSQVESVFATQSLLLGKPKTMKIEVNGKVDKGVSAKDIILFIISKISSSGGTGYFVEFTGSAFEALSMEERMTVCNMSIEMGARGGMIAPDQTTYDYIQGREFAPTGADWDKALAYWDTLKSDDDAKFDKELTFDASEMAPMVTYGTNPGMGITVDSTVPKISDIPTDTQQTFKNSLTYMGFEEGQSLIGKQVNWIFLGSCTNGRIEDLRVFADFVKGKKKADNINALIVPGSKQVEKQAIAEGLDKILEEAGFKMREPGCSSCLAMNDDKIPPGEYSVSTSNRNFEGRQGPGARTILASPLTAAAVAIHGKIVDVREFI